MIWLPMQSQQRLCVALLPGHSAASLQRTSKCSSRVNKPLPTSIARCQANCTQLMLIGIQLSHILGQRSQAAMGNLQDQHPKTSKTSTSGLSMP